MTSPAICWSDVWSLWQAGDVKKPIQLCKTWGDAAAPSPRGSFHHLFRRLPQLTSKQMPKKSHCTETDASLKTQQTISSHMLLNRIIFHRAGGEKDVMSFDVESLKRRFDTDMFQEFKDHPDALDWKLHDYMGKPPLPRIFQVDAGGKTQSIESRQSFRIRSQFGLSMTLAEGRQLLTFKSFRAKRQTLTSKIEEVLMVNVCIIHSVRYYLEMSHVGNYGTTHPKSNNRWLEIWKQRIEALDLWRGKLAFREYPKDDVFDSKVVSTHLWNTPLNLYQQAIKGFLS